MFNSIIYSILKLFPKKIVWVFSKKYIAGQDVEDAIKASKQLNSEGMKVTIDILGEFITKLEEAEANKNEYLDLIDRIEKQKIDGNYSVKPTMFGLLLDKEVCYNHIREIIKRLPIPNSILNIDEILEIYSVLMVSLSFKKKEAQCSREFPFLYNSIHSIPDPLPLKSLIQRQCRDREMKILKSCSLYHNLP